MCKTHELISANDNFEYVINSEVTGHLQCFLKPHTAEYNTGILHVKHCDCDYPENVKCFFSVDVEVKPSDH